MSEVTYNMSMSLDGFVRTGDSTPSNPLGSGGERLHKWFFGRDPANQAFGARMLDSIGAVVAGRTTYDTSEWGADGPTGAARLPTFVVTHKAPSEAPTNGVYTFATTGIVDAVNAAKEAARGKNVSIMGGPSIGVQAIAAGVVDEIVTTVVPVLFGDGLPMFAKLPRHVQLESIWTINTNDAAHIAYRIVK